jgi:putative alpha-1,2-mannosidase
VIEAPEAGLDKPYVQSVTLNGKPLDRAWFTHHEITHGATLHFELASSPGEWGTKEFPHIR